MSDRRKASKMAVSYLVLLCLSYFLLVPSFGLPLGGIVFEYAYRYLGLDVSYVVPYVTIVIPLLLLSKLSETLTERKIGKIISIILNELAILTLVFLFFDVRYPDRKDAPYYYLLLWLCDFREDNLSLRLFAVLGVIGIAFGRARGLVSHEGKRNILGGVSLLLVAYSLWSAALTLSGNVSDFYLGSIESPVIGPFKMWNGTVDVRVSLSDIETAFFFGSLAVAFALFASYGISAKNIVVSRICNWFYRSQLRNFVVGTFFGCYLFIIRPVITVIFPYAVLIEWGIAGIFVVRAYSGFKFEIGRKYTVPLKVASWRKHVQEVTYVEDEDFENVNKLQKIFVEHGEKAPLIIYLTLLLFMNGFKTNYIAQVLAPLIDYEDEKVPFFAFGWEKRRVLERNLRNRKELLGKLIMELSDQGVNRMGKGGEGLDEPGRSIKNM